MHFSQLNSKEFAIVATFTLYITVLHTIYPKVMLIAYGSETAVWLDHGLKVVANLVSHHDRSLLRNIVFNSVRCMSDDVDNFVTFGDR